MRIRITSIACDDLPKHYLQDSWYKSGQLLENFFVGCERDVYAITLSNIHHYFIRLEPDTPYLSVYPAALTEIIDPTIPVSWVVSHESKALHRGLPDHQVVLCPKDWLCPYFSMFVDRLDDECERDVRVFLETTQRDYPKR